MSRGAVGRDSRRPEAGPAPRRDGIATAALGYEVRKWFVLSEEIVHEGGPAPAESLLKVVSGVVICNPLAGRYASDVSALIEPSRALGAELSRRALLYLAGRAVESYGKGGIAGVQGEQEHVVACITTPFGDALRAAIGGAAAWIPSATKVGPAGATLDVPLAYKDALFVRSHYDAMTVQVADAPRPSELVIAIALASGARIHHRVGGLAKSEAAGDGLR